MVKHMSRPLIRRAALAAAMLALLSGCAAVPVAAVGTVVGAGVGQERTTRDALNDIETETTINNNLANHSAELFRRVGVDVIEGRVLLSGAVSTRADAIKAQELAFAAPGVREVINELTIDGDPGVQRYSQDLWITTQLRTKMIGDPDVASVNYNIETHRGVVHLIGLARSDAELERVTGIAASIPGVTQVVSHVLSITDPRRQRA